MHDNYQSFIACIIASTSSSQSITNRTQLVESTIDRWRCISNAAMCAQHSMHLAHWFATQSLDSSTIRSATHQIIEISQCERQWLDGTTSLAGIIGSSASSSQPTNGQTSEINHRSRRCINQTMARIDKQIQSTNQTIEDAADWPWWIRFVVLSLACIYTHSLTHSLTN